MERGEDKADRSLPERWSIREPGALRAVGEWLFRLLAAGYFALDYASLPMFLDLRRYALGQERVPYQDRMLPMFLFRALMDRPSVLHVARHAGPLHQDQFRLILAGLAFACLLVAVKMTEATICRLTGDRVFAFWTSLLVIAMAQYNLAYAWDNPFTTPYDVPSLMFFTIGIFLILRRWWWVYYPVFAVAVVNREAACFVAVFMTVWEWVRLEDQGAKVRERVRRVLPHTVAQAAIWLALKVAITRHFAGNLHEGNGSAGGIFITHFLYNLKELMNPGQWPLLLSVCGFSLPLLWLQRKWIGSRPLVWAMGAVYGLSFVGLMIVGVVVEIRIFADWIALAVPALALILWNRFRAVAVPPAG